ncbi:hypothetical protein NA56DRAFT_648171 [Hyaloscypha hepaticicola]|uniref:Uncharacterized protein n=1 Tax=Hyaloscypha hepaticicola TaxID=2082293 RepID=A0A2J6PVE2_9HELO|nr:hypothetical protein NA56DRAFT_648171 [Hyaloscypha hepaticicola]
MPCRHRLCLACLAWCSRGQVRSSWRRMMPDGKIVVHLQEAQSVRFAAAIHMYLPTVRSLALMNEEGCGGIISRRQAEALTECEQGCWPWRCRVVWTVWLVGHESRYGGLVIGDW